MPPEAFGAASPEASMDAGPAGRKSDIALGDRSSLSSSRAAADGTGRQRQQDAEGQEVLVDDKGRPYNLGPKGFVRDLNTRAVKIARRVMEQSGDTSFSAAAAAAAAAADDGPAAARKNNLVIEKIGAASTPAAAAAAAAPDAGTSGTVRSSVAQEIRFVLGGRLPFVKRSEWLVRTWVCISAYFLLRYGLGDLGFAPTLGAFTIMYFVLDFYSGVLHVVLDDEWNMNVPLLSQPAMEFQYHHHIPDDGCSRPFVEGMGDLNFIVGLHLALFLALFYRGGCEDKMLLTTGAWKMLLAYWGIWNHRQAHQLKSKRPRWCTYLQEQGIMLSPAAHKVHHTPPHDDEYCLLGVTTWPVTFLGRLNLGSVFWIALFLLLTAFDTVCASKLLNVLFGQGGAHAEGLQH